jgi:hypothetical protein
VVALLASWHGAFGQPKPTAEYIRVQGNTVATIHRPVTSSFSDVSTSDPFFEHVQILAERGITLGCGGGLYCASGPSSLMTREQMAAFIVRSIAWAQTGNPEEFRCGPPPGVSCWGTTAYFSRMLKK